MTDNTSLTPSSRLPVGRISYFQDSYSYGLGLVLIRSMLVLLERHLHQHQQWHCLWAGNLQLLPSLPRLPRAHSKIFGRYTWFALTCCWAVTSTAMDYGSPLPCNYWLRLKTMKPRQSVSMIHPELESKILSGMNLCVHVVGIQVVRTLTRQLTLYHITKAHGISWLTL
jgi:hypothetical protein